MWQGGVRFDPSVFEAEISHANGSEGGAEFSREDVMALRRNHPELSAWSDAVIAKAFGDFSSDVLEVSWAEWLLDRRSDLFLCYCRWRQKRQHEDNNQRGRC